MCCWPGPDDLNHHCFFLRRRMTPTKSKKQEKARNKTREQEGPNEVADPLRKAISALGGDDEDYALLKGVDDDHKMVASGSHADVCSLERILCHGLISTTNQN